MKPVLRNEPIFGEQVTTRGASSIWSGLTGPRSSTVVRLVTGEAL
jgi:hypothetical protein